MRVVSLCLLTTAVAVEGVNNKKESVFGKAGQVLGGGLAFMARRVIADSNGNLNEMIVSNVPELTAQVMPTPISSLPQMGDRALGLGNVGSTPQEDAFKEALAVESEQLNQSTVMLHADMILLEKLLEYKTPLMGLLAMLSSEQRDKLIQDLQQGGVSGVAKALDDLVKDGDNANPIVKLIPEFPDMVKALDALDHEALETAVKIEKAQEQMQIVEATFKTYLKEDHTAGSLADDVAKASVAEAKLKGDAMKLEGGVKTAKDALEACVENTLRTKVFDEANWDKFETAAKGVVVQAEQYAPDAEAFKDSLAIIEKKIEELIKTKKEIQV